MSRTSFLYILVGLILAFTLYSSHVQAAGVVNTCDEASPDAALLSGGSLLAPWGHQERG